MSEVSTQSDRGRLKNPFKPRIPIASTESKYVNAIPSRYATPTPRRESLVREAAEKLRQRRELEESQSVALQALRVLRHAVDQPPDRDNGSRINAALLLEQLRHEDERIIGAESPSSRSASRSRSPPALQNRRRSPSAGARIPSPSRHVAGSSLHVRATPKGMVVPPSPVRNAYHANDGKPAVASPRVTPLKLNKDTVDVNPLRLHFDPRYDHSPAIKVESELAPFFSRYIPGVSGKCMLPRTFAVPPPELNPRQIVVTNKRMERERNERMKLLHPPARKKWNYWDRREARKRPAAQPSPSDDAVDALDPPMLGTTQVLN